jgi:hypothetical protein
VESNTFKYYVGPGNNEQIVVKTLKKRYWWVKGKNDKFIDNKDNSENSHFIWSQWKKPEHTESLKLYKE